MNLPAESNKIYLIGLPGSGKSTLGRKLAHSLMVPFIDLDAEIEKSEGMTVQEIFEKKREDYFRGVESNHLRKWAAVMHGFVMATGGGTPCFFDNLTTINQSGKSIFLDVPAREIAQRVSQTQLEKRPLFAKANFESLKDHVEFMRSNRIGVYRQAHHTISGNSISPDDLIEVIRKGIQP